jgi:DNA replication protein DnaD
MDGWIKLYRKLLESSAWKCTTPEQRCVLVTIMLMANYADNKWLWKGKQFACKKGQFITSLQSLSEKACVSVQSVRSAIYRLKKLEFLTCEPTNTGTLITIVNWDFYQGNDEEPNTPPNTPPNKDPTKTQQGPNKDPTHNKNNNNFNNYKNDNNESALRLKELEMRYLVNE